MSATRAEHEAQVARNPRVAARHRELARRWRTVQAKAAAEEQLLTDVQETRCRWDTITESTRRIAARAIGYGLGSASAAGRCQGTGDLFGQFMP